MRRFVEGIDREQATLFPECLEDWIDGDNPVRAIDAFVDKLDLSRLGFDGVAPETTGRPSYHPSGLLKLYIYGYLNRVQSSRRLEREAGRNVEVMWLTCRLVPDHKTIADFRKDNGPALKQVCVQFVELCRLMGLLTTASVAIDGSKFKAVNTRDRNFTRGKVERRRAQLEKSVARYLAQLDTGDLQEPSEELAAKTAHLKEKLVKLESEMQRLAAMEKLMLASPDEQISLTDPAPPDMRAVTFPYATDAAILRYSPQSAAARPAPMISPLISAPARPRNRHTRAFARYGLSRQSRANILNGPRWGKAAGCHCGRHCTFSSCSTSRRVISASWRSAATAAFSRSATCFQVLCLRLAGGKWLSNVRRRLENELKALAKRVCASAELCGSGTGWP